MQKPVILTVDDDPEVLRAIERDLKKHYEERYRVLRAESGRAALDLLRRLQQRNDAVALLLVDHRMPEMNGVELLQEAIKLYPNAKRTLLTAYADTDAAIKAINDVQINHYLLKPWDPPEQELFPFWTIYSTTGPLTSTHLSRESVCSAPAGPPGPTRSGLFSHGTRCPISGWMPMLPTETKKSTVC
jgi:CheY-like chemotaxis protein